MTQEWSDRLRTAGVVAGRVAMTLVVALRWLFFHLVGVLKVVLPILFKLAGVLFKVALGITSFVFKIISQMTASIFRF